MDGMADTRLWAERTFGAANMGDQRRTRRLVHSAAQIAAHPQKSFPQVFELLDLRAFYRLCAQEAATLAFTSPGAIASRQHETAFVRAADRNSRQGSGENMNPVHGLG